MKAYVYCKISYYLIYFRYINKEGMENTPKISGRIHLILAVIHSLEPPCSRRSNTNNNNKKKGVGVILILIIIIKFKNEPFQDIHVR